MEEGSWDGWVGRPCREAGGEVEVKGAWIVYDNCCDRTQPDNIGVLANRWR